MLAFLARRLLFALVALVALAAIVVGLATLISDLGLGPALIRQRPLTTEHLRVGLTTSFLVGLTLATLVFSLAPVAGWFLHSGDLPAVLRA